MGYPVVGAGLPANTGSAGAIHRVASFAGMPTKDRRRLDYQRPAASWSLCRPSTHLGPSWVFSFFQNGARVFR
ncbi:MAG TPA: hypothetical protein DD418_12350 [Pseudomonas sp.]|nr:hypothetical protein [Pseudomonas sp.]